MRRLARNAVILGVALGGGFMAAPEAVVRPVEAVSEGDTRAFRFCLLCWPPTKH